MATIAEARAALDKVTAILAQNASLFGQDVMIEARIVSRNRIALFRRGEEKPAMVLGTPAEAIARAEQAHQRAKEKARG